jgi:hypothetical protein
MSISQADRKLLWGKSGNRCAICKKVLTDDAESASLAGLIFGEEAHVIARTPGGPRGKAEPRDSIDTYPNLILLCPEDHKRIDDQPDEYSPTRLRTLKAQHEQWVKDRLDGPKEFEPIRVLRGANEDAIPFEPLTSGSQVWAIVAGAHMYNFMPLDDTYTDERVDAGDLFRDAQRSIKSLLDDLWAHEIFAWGRRLNRTMTGGVGAPTTWSVAELMLLGLENLPASGPDLDADTPTSDSDLDTPN